LRDAARRVGVPEFVVSRKKADFTAKPDHWAIAGGPLEPLVPLAAREFGEREVRRMQSATWRGGNTFWTMLNYCVWKRLFIDGDSVASLLGKIGQPAAAEVPDEDPVPATSH
jgi:hypothetical protein